MIFQSKKGGIPCYLLVLCLIFTLTASGCAVLTQSQVAEVREFAKATRGYSELPASVIEAYRDVRAGSIMLQTATNTYTKEEDAERAWDDIIHSHKFSEGLTIQADKLRKALSILDTYASLLMSLSSDVFTDEFEKNALQLGKEMDEGIETYNEKFNKELGSIGAAAAAVIRATGGIYIRHKQAELLKLYVEEADGMINELTADIEIFLDPFLTKSGNVESILQAELNKLKDLFITEADQSKDNLQLSTIKAVADMIEKVGDAKKLAEICKTSTEKYRLAHAELKHALSKKQTVKERIEEIQSLVGEIKAARKLKKSLEK